MIAFRDFCRCLPAGVFVALGLGMIGCSGGTVSTTTAPAPLKISYSGSLNGQLTVAFNGSFSISGGSSPYFCSVTSGDLPSGLTLVGNSCTLTGTPVGTDIGAYPVKVSVTDSASSAQTASASVTLMIAAEPLKIATTTLPTGTVNVPFAGSIATSGGVAPVTCKLASGNADGLVVNSNCTLSGTPVAPGTFALQIQAADASSPAQTATSTANVSVLAAPNTRVSSGPVPMVGASVQIYAAGTTGNGSASTALLASPLTTDSSGLFTLPAASAYTCPSASSIVYVVATGGRLGASGPSTPQAVFMASPGACSNLATTSSLVLDEATTAASAYAFAQFLRAGPTVQLGAAPTNLVGLTAAAATANNLVPIATGLAQSVGVASNVSASGAGGVTAQGKINLVANLLNACVAGAASSTPCATLFRATSIGGVVPSNTLWAAVNLVQNPAIATAALYALVPPSPVYTPSATSAPADWTLAVTYAGGGLNHPAGLAIDSIGRVWVANDVSPGIASLFSNLGNPVFPAGVGGNGLYDAFAVAIDGNDTAYITNFDGGYTRHGSLTAISKTGNAVSGFPTDNAGVFYPFGVAVDTTGLAWVADYGDISVSILNPNGSAYGTYQSAMLNFPFGIAVDGNHAGWVTNQPYTTVSKVSQDGKNISALDVGRGPTGVAVDAGNNVWVTNYTSNSVAWVNSVGVAKTTFPGISTASMNSPEGIALDGNGSVWVINYHGNSITELAGAAAASPGAELSPAAGWGVDTQMSQGFGSGVDRSGNLWVASQANSTLTEFVGLAAPTKTPVNGPTVQP